MQISKWKYGVVIALCFVANVILAHDIDMATVLPRQWTLNKGNKNFEGYFYMYKNGNVSVSYNQLTLPTNRNV